MSSNDPGESSVGKSRQQGLRMSSGKKKEMTHMPTARQHILDALKELVEERRRPQETISILYRVRKKFPGYPWPALVNHLFKLNNQKMVVRDQNGRYTSCV